MARGFGLIPFRSERSCLVSHRRIPLVRRNLSQMMLQIGSPLPSLMPREYATFPPDLTIG